MLRADPPSTAACPAPGAPLALFLPDDAATTGFGTALGHCLRPGMVILLQGPIGAGKTHLARAAIRALLGEATEVPSPSFTLVQTYDGPDCDIWHADLYRLTGPEAVLELGLDDAMGRDIVLIEWPDRLGSARPDGAVTLTLSHRADGRSLQIDGATAGLLSCLGLA